MKMAWVFGTLAQQIEAVEGDCAVAVFFRDSDGTRSIPDGAWAEKWVSIEQGFVRARFERGVPMLPKPTSEAWLLCAAKAAPYQNCMALEDLPGNQESERHPKKELKRAFGKENRAKNCANGWKNVPSTRIGRWRWVAIGYFGSVWLPRLRVCVGESNEIHTA